MKHFARFLIVLLKLLPGSLLPISCFLWWHYTASRTPLICLSLFAALQVIYIAIIEWCRRDRDLSPVEDLTFGDPKSDKCIIMVHGFADTPEAWRREAEYLAQKGWRVTVPEISHDVNAKIWVFRLFVEILEARETANHVELWGHSMGGALAIIMATIAPIDRLVLWAPFLAPYMGTFASTTLYILHRLLFIWPYTLTWFPINRHGKGEPETFYRVRRVIPTHTFTAALSLPFTITHLRHRFPQKITPIILLSQRDTVVNNRPVRRCFPNAHYLLAANPRSSHALTNAVDWKENVDAILEIPYETSDSL